MKTVTLSRKTRETDILLTLGPKNPNSAPIIATGVGFFDHMLTAFALHGDFFLELKVNGDLNVDPHHTVEDVGILLGRALGDALDNKGAFARFGHSYIPMDEALAFGAVDISGRPFLAWQCEFTNERIGEFDCCLAEEFFRALAMNSGITLHLRLEYGKNDHHKCEAIFKAAAHAIRLALKPSDRSSILSTKGVLD